MKLFLVAAGMIACILVIAGGLFAATRIDEDSPPARASAHEERIDDLEAEVDELRETQQACAEAIVTLMVNLAEAIGGDYTESVTGRLTEDYLEACQ